MKALKTIFIATAIAASPVPIARAQEVVTPAIGEPPAALTQLVQRVTPEPSVRVGSGHSEVFAAALVGGALVWRARRGRHRII